MNYTKPEVAVLGQAMRVIQAKTAKNHPAIGDGPLQRTLNAAYDLDE